MGIEPLSSPLHHRHHHHTIYFSMFHCSLRLKEEDIDGGEKMVGTSRDIKIIWAIFQGHSFHIITLVEDISLNF